jgi:ABC-type cobalamin/Fe3+-siderophores transport system ATPase subunit
MVRADTVFKVVGPECEILVTQLDPLKAPPRLCQLARPARASAGLILPWQSSFPVNALVQVDMKFPGQEVVYRTFGKVAWFKKEQEEGKLAVTILEMTKVDEAEFGTATVAEPPKSQKSAQDKVGRETTPDLAQDALPQPEARPEHEPAAAPVSEQAPATAAKAMKTPNAPALRELIEGLVGELPEVSDLDSGALALDDVSIIGTVADDGGQTVALWLSDNKFAIRVGAALVMMPSNSADEQIEANELSDDTKDNIKEVFNIASSLVTEAGGPRYRFSTLHTVDEGPWPDDIREMIEQAAVRVDFSVTVAGYGDGALSFLAPDAQQSTGEMAKTKVQLPDAGADAAAESPPAADAGAPEEKPLAAAAIEGGFPSIPDIQEMLTGLVGKDVLLTEASTAMSMEDGIDVIGEYRADERATPLLCCVDCGFAVRAASALMMVPAGEANKAVSEGEISEDTLENLREVFNVGASVLNKAGNAYYRFTELYPTQGGELPADVKQVLENPTSRVDWEGEITDYGAGRMNLMS